MLPDWEADNVRRIALSSCPQPTATPCTHQTAEQIPADQVGGFDLVVCSSCKTTLAMLPSIGNAVAEAVGPVANHTDPAYDPRLAARRLDAIAKHAKDRARRFVEGHVTRAWAVENFGEYHAQLLSSREAR